MARNTVWFSCRAAFADFSVSSFWDRLRRGVLDGEELCIKEFGTAAQGLQPLGDLEDPKGVFAMRCRVQALICLRRKLLKTIERLDVIILDRYHLQPKVFRVI